MDEPDPGFADDELDHEAADPDDDPEPLEDLGEPAEWVPIEDLEG